MKIVNSLKKRLMNPVNYARSIGVKIGTNCEIYRGVYWPSEPYLIEIGDNVRITDGVRFITHDGGVWVLRNLYDEMVNADIFGKITIGSNVHIGVNSIIMPGVKIGNNVIIGCGAVVTHDVEDNTIVAGVPARPIKTVKEYREKHKKNVDNIKSFSREEKENYLREKFLK